MKRSKNSPSLSVVSGTFHVTIGHWGGLSTVDLSVTEALAAVFDTGVGESSLSAEESTSFVCHGIVGRPLVAV
jgi:hypothetical protein